VAPRRYRKIVRPYDTLLKAVQDAHVFKRNKRPLEQKVGCLPALLVWDLVSRDDIPDEDDRGEPRLRISVGARPEGRRLARPEEGEEGGGDGRDQAQY